MGIGKDVASSQINVRIPSFAIVNLADNSLKSVSDKSAPDFKNSAKSDLKPSADVISNMKWSVTVAREESLSDTYSATNSRLKSADPSVKIPSVTVIYVTSLR